MAAEGQEIEIAHENDEKKNQVSTERPYVSEEPEYIIGIANVSYYKTKVVLSIMGIVIGILGIGYGVFYYLTDIEE